MRRGKARGKTKREKPEFDQQIIDLARVTRVTEGGKQLNFRVCIVIGNRKGKVGYGVAKGSDVQIAVEKAVNQAKKQLVEIPLLKETIPHRVEAKYKAAKVMLKPAPRGSGIIAGGATRVVLELAGVPNASAKMLGKTNNKVTNVRATFAALDRFLPKALKQAEQAKPKKEVKAEGKEEKKATQKKRSASPAKKPRAKKTVKKDDGKAEKKDAPKKKTTKKKEEAANAE